MNKLILESIDRIYNDGNLEIITTDYKVKFEISANGNFSIIYNSGYIDNYKHKNFFENKHDDDTLSIYLALLIYADLYEPKGKTNLTLESTHLDVPEMLRLQAINKMYNIYSSMLDYNHDRIRQLILGSSAYQFFANTKVNNNAYLNYNDLKHTLKNDLSIFSLHLYLGIEIYKKLSNASSQEEYDNALREWEKFIAEKEKNNLYDRNVYVDTTLLQKANIAYEFIDERKFEINPAIGRDSEIREICSSLLTPSFSSLILGEPGVGKTAIIEGVAYKLKTGDISNRISNMKIMKVTPSAIVSGCSLVGMFEQKMETLIQFLKDNPNIILYIDEIHTAKGAGTGGHDNNDILNILKPHIENGSIRMIIATTIKEYDKYLSEDEAFTSRFRLTTIKEPDRDLLRDIVNGSIEKYESQKGIIFESDEEIKDRMIEILMDATGENHRVYYDKKCNPRLALSIIQTSFGYADYDGSKNVGIKYLSESLEKCEYLSETARNTYSRVLNNIIPSELPKIIKIGELKKKKTKF